MPREKFEALTEQMFYILLCLQVECYGMDIMQKIRTLTDGRVNVGPGTLYHLLDDFLQAGIIRQTQVQGRRRCYLLTEKGAAVLEGEYQRLKTLTEDYRRFQKGVEDL